MMVVAIVAATLRSCRSMKETADDLAWLQDLLDRSIERAGAFLRSSFEMPGHSLSAAQLVRLLDGLPTVALATVTAQGEPRVAPIGAIFWRARFHIPTVATAARTRHLRARPAVSLTHYAGIDLAVLVHGHASIVTPAEPLFGELDAYHREQTGGQGVGDWGEGVFLRIEPAVLYTYARFPNRFGT
jgi:hypothetical protein